MEQGYPVVVHLARHPFSACPPLPQTKRLISGKERTFLDRGMVGKAYRYVARCVATDAEFGQLFISCEAVSQAV